MNDEGERGREKRRDRRRGKKLKTAKERGEEEEEEEENKGKEEAKRKIKRRQHVESYTCNARARVNTFACCLFASNSSVVFACGSCT